MATAAARPLRERVAFRPDKTIQATIEGPGTQQDGRDGPEWRYMLAGNRIMWVPQEAHDAITRTGARPPLTVEITKTAKGWLVVHVEDEPDQAKGYGRPSPTPPAQPPAQPARQQRPADTSTQQRQLPDTNGQPWSASLYECTRAALRVAKEAELYAQQIGRPVAFETGDIRCMAATLFIDGRGTR